MPAIRGRKKLFCPLKFKLKSNSFGNRNCRHAASLREVRNILRKAIEKLGQGLLLLNMLFVPLIVGIVGVGCLPLPHRLPPQNHPLVLSSKLAVLLIRQHVD